MNYDLMKTRLYHIKYRERRRDVGRVRARSRLAGKLFSHVNNLFSFMVNPLMPETKRYCSLSRFAGETFLT